jgi:AraC-like DNA-binding protein
MNELPVHNDFIFDMLYGAVTVSAIIACCYLLFRLGNAFAPNITSPVRLRRCAAAYIAAVVLSHVLWILVSNFVLIDDHFLSYAIAIGLDSVMLNSTMMAMLFAMLQDRRRPFWPIAVAMVPFVVIVVVCIAIRSDALDPLLHVYDLSLNVCFIIYMIFATKQYWRWLHDNYADLEHKEMWLSFMALAVMLVMFVVYENDNGNSTVMYFVEVSEFVFIGLLIWRVETLQQLDAPSTQKWNLVEEPTAPAAAPSTISSNIGKLLEQHCEATQLYLRHDLTLLQLSEAVGTNHTYLSQHFAQQGMNYNAYINGLRIQHFINLYHEAIATQRPFTAQQLANESGFRSYSTFSAAFKQRMGQTVTSWMRDSAEKE